MKFKKIFKSIDEANTYFKPTSPYLTKVVDHIFSDRQTICNGTISKIDFFNIVATALGDIIPVIDSDVANIMIDYTVNVTLNCKFSFVNWEIEEQGDELFYVIAAIYFELCIHEPEYKKEWQFLRHLILNENQQHYFNLFIKKIIK